MFGNDAVGAALRDLAEGVRLAPLWWRLGLEQTVARYRRTLLGPFWLASGTIAAGLAISLVFGTLFGTSTRDALPFILSGVVAFNFISSVTNDGSQTFLQASGMMQIRKLPLSFHLFLQLDRTLINFAHQVVAFWIVMLIVRMFPVPHWQLIFGLAVVMATGFFISLPLGMLSTRYRDVSYSVGTIMSAAFMLTPVFWHRAQIRPKLRWIVDYNPIAHLLEIIRQPFLGHPAPASDWAASMMILFISMGLGGVSLILFRRRVVFWL